MSTIIEGPVDLTVGRGCGRGDGCGVFTINRVRTDPVTEAIRWMRTRGVEVIISCAVPLAADRPTPCHPVLYLLERRVVAPRSWSLLEDWVRLPADSGELYDRADRLLSRAAAIRAPQAHVDRDGILRAGTRLVALSPISAQIMGSLLDQAGALVSRRDLEAQLWPDDAPSDCRALDNRIKHLRRHLVGIPLVIHTVRGRGYLLEHGCPSTGSELVRAGPRDADSRPTRR